jgi:hypothetical protein
VGVLKAKVNGVWQEISGGGTGPDEVVVSDIDPFVTYPDKSTDLWYDVSSSTKRTAPAGSVPAAPKVDVAEYSSEGNMKAGRYYFRLTAVNENGESEPSEEYFINIDGVTQRSFKVHFFPVPGVRVYRHYVSSTPHVFKKFRTTVIR